jgi:H+/Na+-translocating ferredoxin:NAD+ oxidoreductase subunit B
MDPTASRTKKTGPMKSALIDESRCIGCTLCIQACPFDAIVGAARRMHTVVESLCIGCELCIAPCPVDCISMTVASPERVWTRAEAMAAGARVKARKRRLERERLEREARLAARAGDTDDPIEEVRETGHGPVDRISAIVQRALQRARQRRSGAPR